MRVDPDDLRRLLRLLEFTAADEIDCDEFLARVAALIERLRPGEQAPAGAAEVLQHMRVCPECAEEVEAMLRALAEDGD